jgi:hypothetical protein
MHISKAIAILFFALLVASVAATVGCFNSGPPADDPKQLAFVKHREKTLSRVASHYDNLDPFLNRADQEAVRAVHKEYREKLTHWHQQNGALVVETRADLAKFLTTQDKGARKRARDPERKRRVKEAVLLNKEIQLEYETALIRAIPKKKFVQWQQDKISRTVMGIMDSLQLNKDQEKQIYELSSEVLRDAENLKHWHSDAAAKLERIVEQRVLTPAQKKDFETIKIKKQFRYMSWNA